MFAVFIPIPDKVAVLLYPKSTRIRRECSETLSEVSSNNRTPFVGSQLPSCEWATLRRNCLFIGYHPPSDWDVCDGSVLQIAQNTALFALYGISFGGDGQSTFALPTVSGAIIATTGLYPVAN